MTNKIKYLLPFLLILAFFEHSFSQELKIVRTDVESSRSNFVTATYIFGIDIQVDSLQRSNGVTFELHYTKADSILLNESRIIGFGPKATSIVIPVIDSINKTGTIYVGVLSGDTVGVQGYDNPKVIHLEFAVSPTCRNRSELAFSFVNAKSIVNTDSGGSVVSLKSNTTKYAVHGFIDVWPGDADGNGIVEINDVTKIGLYLGFGSFLKPMRSFKRQSSSTNWVPQSVLGWDSLDVTFADCDGNGDITVTDMLIIALNFQKKHTVAKNDDNTPLGQICYSFEITQNSVSIPIYVNSSEEYIGLTSKIYLSSLPTGFKLLGIEKSNIFGNSSFVFCKEYSEQGYAEFVIGALGKIQPESGRKLVGYAVFEPSGQNYTIPEKLNLTESYGMSQDGFLFPLETVLSVEDEELCSSRIITSGGNIYIKPCANLNQSSTLAIIDINGRILRELAINSFNQIDLTELQLCSGNYFARISNGNKSEVLNFSISY